MTQTGIITDFALHIAKGAGIKGYNIFAPCMSYIAHSAAWKHDYEEGLMKRVLRAMRQLRLITVHGKMKDSSVQIEDLTGNLYVSLKIEAASGLPPEGMTTREYLTLLPQIQPILEAIRVKTQELVKSDDDGED